MPDRLDAIPWADLTHAYGSAEDVPALLRELRTAPPELEGDDSPLYQLFGNICHQGTVYEATAYAVPFLLELAADRRTPDRVGVLHLLAVIAHAARDTEAEGSAPPLPEREAMRARERQWADVAHQAVAAGFHALTRIAWEPGEVGLAAAHVLAQLRTRSAEVAPLLRGLLAAERNDLWRAGLLLCLGVCGDAFPETLATLVEHLGSRSDALRWAAALSIAALKPRPLPPSAVPVLQELLVVGERATGAFSGLPWDYGDEVDLRQAASCLGAAQSEEVAARLIEAVETDSANNGQVTVLLDLLFPTDYLRPRLVTPETLSPLQAHAVRALAAMEARPRRVFYGAYRQWGLPDTRRDWCDLVAGRPSTPVDMSRPRLADPAHPERPLRPDLVVPGQRICHRHFGDGTVLEASSDEAWARLTVDFDEEGRKQLSFRASEWEEG